MSRTSAPGNSVVERLNARSCSVLAIPCPMLDNSRGRRLPLIFVLIHRQSRLSHPYIESHQDVVRSVACKVTLRSRLPALVLHRVSRRRLVTDARSEGQIAVHEQVGSTSVVPPRVSPTEDNAGLPPRAACTYTIPCPLDQSDMVRPTGVQA